MCSGNGAPGISTTFSGKRGMSDKRALLPLFDRILSHLARALLSTWRRVLPLVGGSGQLVGERTEFGGGRWRRTRHRGGDGTPARLGTDRAPTYLPRRSE